MESRSVFRDHLIVYPDLYYIWTYRPKETFKNFYKQSEHYLYKKHYCGVGFYSAFHARHVVGLMFGTKALKYIHIVKGSTLIEEEGMTTFNKWNNDRIFINSPHTKYGDRRIRKWIYPPEFRYDKHRRRHFILYLVRAAEEKGPAAFNKKYKKYFNGYRESIPVIIYLRKKEKIFRRYLKEYRLSMNLPENGIEYDSELLREYAKKKRAEKKLANQSKKDDQIL